MNNLIHRTLSAYRRLQATRDSSLTKDVALAAARVGLCWIFVYHGAGTLFNAFSGPGIHGQAIYFAHTAGLHPGTFFAVLSGIIEFFGGVAIGLGVFGRLAALGLVGDMAIAMATVTWGHGLVGDSTGSGYELNVALAALAFVVALLGTGRLSLDYGLRTWLSHRQAPLSLHPMATSGSNLTGTP